MILKYPDPRLTAENEPLGAWTQAAAERVEEMRKAMKGVAGIGLAAPQIGWNVRLFIMDIPNRTTGQVEEKVVFDPSIATIGNLVMMPEGCLSFPGIPGRVLRYARVKLRGKTPEGDLEEVLEGLAAQAVQHEMDHLNGILFIDRMLAADRKLTEPKIRIMERDWNKGGFS